MATRLVIEMHPLRNAFFSILFCAKSQSLFEENESASHISITLSVNVLFDGKKSACGEGFDNLTFRMSQ